MNKFEELLPNFLNETAVGREQRLAHNVALFGISTSDAELLDTVLCDLVRDTVQLIGRRVDSNANPVIQAALVLLSPKIVAMNLLGVQDFVDVVIAQTAVEGSIITPNPNKPDCDCENCELARAVSQLCMTPTNPSGTTH